MQAFPHQAKGFHFIFSCCHCYLLLGSHLQLLQGERSSGRGIAYIWGYMPAGTVWLQQVSPSPILPGHWSQRVNLPFAFPLLVSLLLLPCLSTFHPFPSSTPCPCSNIGGSGSFLSRGYRNNPRFCWVSVFPQRGLEKCVSTCSCMRTRDGGSSLAAGVSTGCVL